MHRSAIIIAALLSSLVYTGYADPTPEIDYQGKILINDLPFTGDGQFKLAISDSGSTTNYWANDGTTAGEPISQITNSVYNGVFSVVLGESPMTAIDPGIFSNGNDLYLRVWFSEDGSAFSELLPSQRLVSGAYAINADLLDGYHASDLISAATNAVTLNGDISGAPSANNITAGVIVDADINANAAIQATKVANTALVQNTTFSGDVSGLYNNLQIGAGAVGSDEIADGSITNDDIAADANISGTKVEQGTTSNRGTLQLASGATNNVAIGEGDPRLNAYGSVNTLTATSPNSLLNITGSDLVTITDIAPDTIDINAKLPDFDNVVWVAPSGSSAGPGTLDFPYQTPQQGYNAAAAKYSSQPSVVVIATGDYAANLNMSSGLVHVVGLGRVAINRLNVTALAAGALNGKQRVENIIFTDTATVTNTGGSIKFQNCRFNEAVYVYGPNTEFRDCAFNHTGDSDPAVTIGNGVNAISGISLHHSSIDFNSGLYAALLVQSNVTAVEVLWCEVANVGGAPAIIDDEGSGALNPLHLYAHNYIKSTTPAGLLVSAVRDNNASAGPTMAFHNNVVWGHVGVNSNAQFYANNAVHGIINNVGGPLGWSQAGAGAGADAANNTEHEVTFPVALPNEYND